METELDYARQLLSATKCSLSALNQYRLQTLKALCQEYKLEVRATGRRGALKADFASALRRYVGEKNAARFSNLLIA